ncbi:MAG: hypothetical protein EOO47_18920 [Flavobacterium sp.]|nr:MAG: hypothetical protein EOO47_18920 [Flavobacterium sp.]
MTKERYRHLITTARDSHMNMLRVWGGGIYESQEFYDLCDEYGILVWQDFMFASGMYPDDNALKRNIYLEAGENVKRLRNHASIALWCGDNEAAMLWGRWISPSFKNRFWDNPADSTKIINTYTEIMHSILPSAIKRYDDEKFYWSSSPQSNNYAVTDENTMESGDMHYWGVWWDKKPFSEYNQVISPFASEYGFQSFPSMETIETFATADDYDINSDVMKLHQKSSIGNNTITEYMKLYYNVPKRFEDFIYVGQLLQADGIKTAIEAHRRNKPFTMGSLYWQLNDSWPVASWSGMDYYGRWKALQYQVKRSFQETILSIVEEGGKVNIYAITDKQTEISGRLLLKAIDLNGNILHSSVVQIKINPNQSLKVIEMAMDKLIKNNAKSSSLLKASLVVNNQVVCDAIHYFSEPKNLNLTPVSITKSLVQSAGTYELTLATDRLAKSVKISVKGKDIIFSDNYIDILPGEKKKISFKADQKIVESDIVIICLNDLKR